MKRKKDYPLLLALTVLLTLGAVIVLISGMVPGMKWVPLSNRSGNVRLITGVLLLACAGAVCVTRKRLFTE